MVLGTPLNKKQCMSCTCIIGDSISFSKAVLLHTEFHKQKESGEGRRDRNYKMKQAGWLAKQPVQKLLSSWLTKKRPKKKKNTGGLMVNMTLFDRSQTGIFKNYIHASLKSTASSLSSSWLFSNK